MLVGFDERTNHLFYHETTNPVKEELLKRGYAVEKLDLFSGINVDKRFDIIVSSYLCTSKDYPTDKLVYLPHGISPWKKIGVDRQPTHFFCCSSYDIGKYFNKDNKKYYVTGWPKLDWLVENRGKRDEHRKSLIKKLGLDPKFPIVAYVPTFTRRDEAKKHNGGTLLRLKEVAHKKIRNFVVAPHYFDETHGEVKEILKNCKAIFREPNKNLLLLGADILVGDISSLLIESLVVDVPIIHLHNGSWELFELYNEGGHRGLCTLGRVCEDPKELPRIVSEVLQRDEYVGLRRYWRNRFLHVLPDKTATSLAADAVEAILKE